MPLYNKGETASFRMSNVKPFRYHAPRLKSNISPEKQRRCKYEFGLLLFMLLLGFSGAAGQGGDAFSQSHEDSHLSHMMAPPDLSAPSEDILINTGPNSQGNSKNYVNSGEHKPDDFNHSSSEKSNGQFLNRNEPERLENSHVQSHHIQFDVYENGNEANTKTDHFHPQEAVSVSFSQNLKNKLKETDSQLLPVVPIQLPSPDKSHHYHYTDDEDSEFKSFAQFTASELDSNQNFEFRNDSSRWKPKSRGGPKRRKSSKSNPNVQSIFYKEIGEDHDVDDHIQRASVQIMKTKTTKRPSILNSNSTSLATASSEAFPSIRYIHNIDHDEYFASKKPIGYNMKTERRPSFVTREPFDSPRYSRNRHHQHQQNYRNNELNSDNYADYMLPSDYHHDDDSESDEEDNESESHTLDTEDDEETPPAMEKPTAAEIPRVPIPSPTSVNTNKNLNHSHHHNDEDDESEYNLSSIASSTFGLREKPKIFKSRNSLSNRTVTTTGRESAAADESNDAREDDRSQENREQKNNDDNESKINKLRDSFSDTSDSDDSVNFSSSNGRVNSNELMMRRRPRRSVVHLYDMVVCATGCNPLMYKGYGCYCGFLGSGLSVDGIDKCCHKHDVCYHHAKCPPLLTYFVPYYWTCHDSRPKCVTDYRGWKGICGTHLCECDRQFAECLRKFPCPRSRAMCMTSPWRFWQNLLMSPPYRYG